MSINRALRQHIAERANHCCEYCRLAVDDQTMPFHVDHVVPKKHAGNDAADNLALACYKCNGYKGSNVAALDPMTSKPVQLFNPRTQRWDKHFRLTEQGEIVGITSVGRATAFVLRMNELPRVKQRKALIRLRRYPC